MDALDIVVKQGKVLYLGISDCPAWFVAACNTYAKWVVQRMILSNTLIRYRSQSDSQDPLRYPPNEMECDRVRRSIDIKGSH